MFGKKLEKENSWKSIQMSTPTISYVNTISNEKQKAAYQAAFQVVT